MGIQVSRVTLVTQVSLDIVVTLERVVIVVNRGIAGTLVNQDIQVRVVTQVTQGNLDTAENMEQNILGKILGAQELHTTLMIV